jgi:hypothetical protein
MKPSKARVKRAYHFVKQVAEDQQVQQDRREQHLDVLEVDPRTGLIRVIHVVVRRVNFVIPLCDALLGEQHSVRYRMGAGVVVMALGVTLAKTVGHVANPLIAYSADAIGFGIHALGMVPFIDHLIEKFKHRIT